MFSMFGGKKGSLCDQGEDRLRSPRIFLKGVAGRGEEACKKSLQTNCRKGEGKKGKGGERHAARKELSFKSDYRGP